MLKFLRLYQGWILAVFGTILLITFLLPQAITGLFQYSAVTGGDWATVGNDENVTNGQLLEVQKELRVLERIPPQYIPAISILGASQDPAYWYLISREASQAGLVGGAGQGRELLASIVQRLQAEGRQTTETQYLVQLMGGSDLTDQEVLKTLAKIQGVTDLSEQYVTAARYSDERLRQAAAELALAVDADIVVLDATKDSASSDEEASDDATEAPAPTPALTTPEPDEAELQAQFEKHKAENPGEGTSGFGYRLPDRARLEWITVSKADVKTGLDENAQLDPIELRKEFINNPEAFGAGATDAEAPKFADYQELVRDRVLRRMLDERMSEIEKFLSDQTQLPRRGLERSGVVYVLPEDWNQRQANFEELAAALGEEFQMAPAQASSSRDVLGAADIDALPGLGSARSSKFGRVPTRASEYAMAAAEFNTDSAIPSQMGIASPVFKDSAGNLYIFRVTETDPAREPHSVDEVRENVTADAKNLARFKALEARAPELETEAVEYGLQPIAEKYDSTVTFSPDLAKADQRMLAFGVQSPTRIRGLAQSEQVIDAIVARAAELDYTQPATDLPKSDRTLVVPDEENLAVVVVQITAVKPLTQEGWADLAAKGGMMRVLATEETALDFAGTFSLEALTKRHKFETLRVQSTDGEDASESTSETETTSNTPASDEETVG